jgi:hypothetical protein
VLLERSSRSDYRVMVHVKGVEMKRYSGMTMMMHWGMGLVKRIFMEICIMIWVVRDHYGVDSWDVRAEIRGPFSRL